MLTTVKNNDQKREKQRIKMSEEITGNSRKNLEKR
jgi:hypothetical protein